MSVGAIYPTMGQLHLVRKSLAGQMCEWDARIQPKHVQRHAASLVDEVEVKPPFHLQDLFRTLHSDATGIPLFRFCRASSCSKSVSYTHLTLPTKRIV